MHEIKYFVMACILSLIGRIEDSLDNKVTRRVMILRTIQNSISIWFISTAAFLMPVHEYLKILIILKSGLLTSEITDYIKGKKTLIGKIIKLILKK